MTLLAGQTAISQTKKSNNFYLYYGIAGMGSNIGDLKPTIIVRNNHFVYKYVQNSYFGKRDVKSKFVNKGIFRQSSIDSIRYLVQGLKDSTIYRDNFCILSGAIIHIANGNDTTRFILHNTFDTTMLKIIDIINHYLPNDKKLYGSINYIREEEDCRNKLQDRLKQKIDSMIKQEQGLKTGKD